MSHSRLTRLPSTDAEQRTPRTTEKTTMPATYDDANLVMQIVRWGTEMGLTDAVLAVLADDFDPETASTDDPFVLKVLTLAKWSAPSSIKACSTAAWCRTCGGWRELVAGRPGGPATTRAPRRAPPVGKLEKLGGLDRPRLGPTPG